MSMKEGCDIKAQIRQMNRRWRKGSILIREGSISDDKRQIALGPMKFQDS